MPRRKPHSDANQEPEIEILQPDQPEPEAIRRKNVLKQEWVETVRPDKQLPASEARHIVESEEPEEIEIDPVQEFLLSLDQQQGYTLLVYRLTSFNKDGRTGIKAPKTFCGSYQFDLNAYLEAIQNDHCQDEAGSFFLTLRHPEGYIVKNWTEHIGRAPQSKRAQLAPLNVAAQQAAPVIVQQSAPDALGQLDQLASFAEKLQSIRKAMGWDEERQPVVIEKSAPAPEEKPLQDRIIETALMKLLERGDESTIDRVLNVIGGNSRSEPGIMDFLTEIAKPLLPLIAQSIVQAQTAPSAPARSQQPGPAQIGAAPSSQQPALGTVVPMPPPVTPFPQPISAHSQLIDEQFEEEPYMELIFNLIEECSRQVQAGALDQVAIERGAGWVRQFQAEYPEWAALLQTLLQGPPESVLASLCLIAPEAAPLAQLPLARDFIAALQAKLRGESNG